MSTPSTDTQTAADTNSAPWPKILTFRAHKAPRMESVRVQLNGNRIKAAGRIIGGACDEHPAFSASYDLVTDEAGKTRRLSVRAALATGEKQISISRDSEGYWLVDNGAAPSRSMYGGALDVDLVWSPFFNTLAIRRLKLQDSIGEQNVPVVYVGLPTLTARPELLTYSDASTGSITVVSPVGTSPLTVDAEGFVLNYDGLAERI
ncbi:putative glycolipid-binding domain-containing protein [Actinomycetes bacterium M1A6_2h]